MMKPFEDAVLALPVGGISGLVRVALRAALHGCPRQCGAV
jgi:hypothetical protein